MKRIAFLLLAALTVGSVSAQIFENHFEEKTLRLDYAFTGNVTDQAIYLQKLSQTPLWAGRKHHLAELPLAGNGDITMKEVETGYIIYRHSFSSLFQEWQATEEAMHVSKSFENSFLVPYPKSKVEITVRLKNNMGKITSELKHVVDPTDANIEIMGVNHIAPWKYLHKGGDLDKCIDVAILAEGYTEEEMDIFYQDAQIACESLFNHEVYAANKDRFNIIAVGAPSMDSGVSVPQDGVWKKTAVGSHFNTFYSKRYLTAPSTTKIHDVMAGIPYEHLIILANTNTYGGGGIYNAYTLTTAHHSGFRPVVVHEFGHSFAGLGDEYYYDDKYNDQYPDGAEPWNPNLTTLVDFDSKWKDMLPEGIEIPTPPVKDKVKRFTEIGVYEGGGYRSKGVYRPCTECRMKINEAPDFCAVCARATQRLIDFYTQE